MIISAANSVTLGHRNHNKPLQDPGMTALRRDKHRFLVLNVTRDEGDVIHVDHNIRRMCSSVFVTGVRDFRTESLFSHPPLQTVPQRCAASDMCVCPAAAAAAAAAAQTCVCARQQQQQQQQQSAFSKNLTLSESSQPSPSSVS